MTNKPLLLTIALTLAACSNNPASNGDTTDMGGADTATRDSGNMTGDTGGSVNNTPDASTSMTDTSSTTPDMGAADTSTNVDLGPPPDPLDGAGTVELVQEGFQFTEGPRWFESEGVLRFSDVQATTIFELAEPDTITTYAAASSGSNGLAFDGDGNVLAAEHDGRRISVYLNDVRTALVDAYQNQAFNSPNDLVVRDDGVIYFTDPPYGLGNRPREISFNGLFRYVPGSAELTAEWEGDQNATRPNGVVLSPDESVLYLADTQASKVYAFDVASDGTLSGQRDFVDVGGPDGMAIDTFGNLYVASSNGIAVFAPNGTSWGVLSVPRQPANCAFGGADARTLYITARQGLYRVQLAVVGIY